MKAKPLPSQELLRQLLDYDPLTGVLTWRERPVSMFASEVKQRRWNSGNVGNAAFTSRTKAGYYHGSILYRYLLAHRVIWKWMTGDDPDFVDHDNGIRSDNCWKNLVDVTFSRNCHNVAVQKRSRSGVIGVVLNDVTGRWVAKIKHKGITTHLGTFDTIEAAAEVRAAASLKLGFHPNHGRAA